MGGRNEELIDAVDDCINKLCEEFENHPTQFFTENDLTCRLYSMIQKKGGELSTYDKEGKKHMLLHTEYATPFKCSMANGMFLPKEDNSRYRRGHYDLIVLNPKFIQDNDYLTIFGQSFDEVVNKVRPWQEKNGEYILYGIEIMLKRRKLTRIQTEGKQWKTWGGRLESAGQDYDKLKYSVDKGCMKEMATLYFIREYSRKIEEYIDGPIGAGILEGKQIRFCFGNPPRK